jgi:hypothetical protein
VIPAPSNVRVVRHGDHHSVESWSRVAPDPPPHPDSAPRLRTPTSSVSWMPSSLAQVWRIVPIGRFTPVGARPVAEVPVAARPVAQGGRSDHPLVCLSLSMASCPPRPPSADRSPLHDARSWTRSTSRAPKSAAGSFSEHFPGMSFRESTLRSLGGIAHVRRRGELGIPHS